MNQFRQKIGDIFETLFANWLASIFYFVLPALYEIKFSGLQNYRASPSTLITINHKRDLDILIIAPNLHLRRTLFKNKLRLHFIARDDLFEPGFLTAHFMSKGRIGYLIHKVNIGPIMRALRAHPISHLVHMRLNSLTRDVIHVQGDIKLEEALKPEYLDAFSERLGQQNKVGFGDVTLSQFLGFDYRALHETPTDVVVLKVGISRKVRAESLKTIEKQLQECADILNNGSICLLAPEGQLSPDGRFWPVKSGLYRLLSMTKTDVKILPINTTYNFMTQKRMRIYVNIGEELDVTRGLTKIELGKMVQKNIVSLGRVTMGQLGSEYLLQKIKSGDNYFSENELTDEIKTRVQTLSEHGLHLDNRLMEKQSFDRRVQDFINYCLKQCIIERNSRNMISINADKVLNNSGTDFRQNPVQYSYNELHSLLEVSSLL